MKKIHDCYMVCFKINELHKHSAEWMKPDTKLDIVSYYLYGVKIEHNQPMLTEV